MRLVKIELKQFRSYVRTTYAFGQLTTVLLGKNAVGKTNVLEAIYLLATGESFRAEKIEEMVRWGEEVALIVGEITNNQITFTKQTSNSNDQISNQTQESDATQLQVTLTRGEVQGKRAQKRLFKVNGVGRRRADFSGILRAVVFRPEDLVLISGSPSKRRGFLDGVLMQADKEYTRSHVSYEKGLRRRNKLLDLIKDGETDRRALWFWDELLVRTGEVITQKRRDLVNTINATNFWDKGLQIVYEASVISPARLKQYEREEIAAGYTLVGPHRDDFKIVAEKPKSPLSPRIGRASKIPGFSKDTAGTHYLKEGKDLYLYGSRGEQRMAVLWLKMHELEYIEQQTGERPLLLLDDIFSELDEEHDRMVMELLGKQQTIITTTEMDGRFKETEVDIIRLTETK